MQVSGLRKENEVQWEESRRGPVICRMLGYKTSKTMKVVENKSRYNHGFPCMRLNSVAIHFDGSAAVNASFESSGNHDLAHPANALVASLHSEVVRLSASSEE